MTETSILWATKIMITGPSSLETGDQTFSSNLISDNTFFRLRVAAIGEQDKSCESENIPQDLNSDNEDAVLYETAE